ncbi:N-acetylglucosamine-6-phosphate deacetylase [Roseobacter sp. YSTF-M11]|uniref:N-acetylglucosamine-6-phosphate deacetylase n=1 Tax=Roseobacter insulae TaxID=2859783 RepID=A0A9X1FUA6_9RHOB|nr:N-acetylglucosamine-6-phosphate deacetylase [Roseobacter insulae]MBW4707018.1 N-acetylglucosamine-6-phosphate deacetylase [Roseobacter insulae]
MTKIVKAYAGAQIHDGHTLHENRALAVLQDGQVALPLHHELPPDCDIHKFDGGVIVPGFVDLQVNGGGGIMFNDNQSVDTLATIARAHTGKGTVAILPTLITDTPDRTRAAITAVEQAIAQRVDGIAGIHLEGPHLSVTRKGAHDPDLIRPMEEDDLRLLLHAGDRLPNVMVTVAPESTSLSQITTLTDAGVIVSLGHTDADHDTCMAAFDAGASCVTHLFNAMSQMGNREPGLVGAALARDDVYAGLIADGIHVHPATMRNALAAKSPSDRIFLVTDAMATAGSDIESFTLNGRDVFRNAHRLTLADGTLAGADLDMARAISVLIEEVGEDPGVAFTRATSTPAELLRERGELGRLSSNLDRLLYFDPGTLHPQRLSEVQAIQAISTPAAP